MAVIALLCFAAAGWTGHALILAPLGHASAPLHEARGLTGTAVEAVRRMVHKNDRKQDVRPAASSTPAVALAVLPGRVAESAEGSTASLPPLQPALIDLPPPALS